MPFSDRIHSLPHLFTTNSSWLFHMQGGSKPIFHLEAYIAKFMSIYKKHLMNAF